MSVENAARELACLRAQPKAEVHVRLEGAFDPLPLEKWSAEAGRASFANADTKARLKHELSKWEVR